MATKGEKKHKEILENGMEIKYNDSEMFGIRFNMLDEREKERWIHVVKHGKATSYFKDLILLDMTFNLLDGGDAFKKVLELKNLQKKVGKI